MRELSDRFPDARFRLLAGYRVDEAALELGEVVADEPGEIVAAMRSHPSISQYELLESTDGRALAKYEAVDTDLYAFVESSSLPIEFPVVAQAGWFAFDLTGTRAEFEQLDETLEAAPVAYELGSIVHAAADETLVTDRQRELLAAALRAGYYEVPRECTLAELADSVGIDKSSASTILRRGEATILEWFLTGPEPISPRGR